MANVEVVIGDADLHAACESYRCNWASIKSLAYRIAVNRMLQENREAQESLRDRLVEELDEEAGRRIRTGIRELRADAEALGKLVQEG